MGQDSQGAKVRNYAIAGFFVFGTLFVIALISVVVFFIALMLQGFESASPNTWAECRNDSANVFISANEKLEDVKCVALDREFFANPEIVVGDLAKNDEDVCRFKLARNTNEPLRFEVHYNGKVKREVCQWQHSPEFVD